MPGAFASVSRCVWRPEPVFGCSVYLAQPQDHHSAGVLPEPDRGAQGHHRCPALVSASVPRYGRDDVEPQLRCQVVDAIDREWVPYVPVDRGLHFLQLEATCSAPATPVIPSPLSQDAHSPVVAKNLRDLLEVNSDAPTEPESESEAESAFSSDCSDAGAVESVASAGSLEGEGASEHCFSGPWLLNIRSSIFHKAIRNVQEDSHMLACRPLHDGYELRRRNPRFEGFCACRHSGCCNSLQ